MQADLLDRVRKLLAKAEAEGVTQHEAEALTAKAADLMARYGIDRALLGAIRPETDRPTDRVFTLVNPWGDVKRQLLAGLATALRCQCVQTRTAEGTRLHVFGYASDLERADVLFTSLLVQMARALAKQAVPGYGGAARAWRRSWMLGYCAAVVARVRTRRGGGGRVARPATRPRPPPAASRRRWCSRTARWWCAGRSRRPTPGCARPASPTRATVTATGTVKGSGRTSASPSCGRGRPALSAADGSRVRGRLRWYSTRAGGYARHRPHGAEQPFSIAARATNDHDA